ncbi:MAG TPA: FAD binding domain-containing protein [Ignavibacteria bacterium]|nr:(2Fe-2S)-binding protein [Bacteroidota bacterium]HRI84965.1 FAD binding domain-containing protein [Ignavibacteria bacterium]HRJ99650.1 FAD binding domain-containing protein [Ignavibacteria bacterium]
MNQNITFLLNNSAVTAVLNPAAVTLDFLRSCKLTGAKEGCKEGDCGACTVICGTMENDKVIYRTVNSCLVPVMNIHGSHIVTIEGLNLNNSQLSPVQSAFLSEGAAQCGFCTPGFIVSLTAFFLSSGNLKNNNILDFIDGNVCRCTGHSSIIRAAVNIKKEIGNAPDEFEKRLLYLINKNIIPEYFLTVKEKLTELYVDPTDNNNSDMPDYYVGGGTDLFVQKPDEMLSSDLSFIFKRNTADNVFEDDGYCCLRSSSTVTDILESALLKNIFPGITDFSELFGSTPIRNNATVGGNINNASPIGDMTAFFLALDSDVILTSDKSERAVSLKDYFVSYKKTVRSRGEIIKFIRFKIPKKNFFINFEKVSKRTYLDIASVNTAIYIEYENERISKINISAGGVFETPKFLSLASEFLTGKKINAEVIKEAVRIADAEISPISDARGSESYKRLLLSRLIYTHFIKLFPELIDIKETV